MNKQELRQALKANHPDRGGDEEVYRKLLEQYVAFKPTNVFNSHVDRIKRQEDLKRKRDNLFKV